MDFDTNNIKIGLDQIDDELDTLEDQKPKDEDDINDEEIDQIMVANQELRLKVGQICDLVALAIGKAKEVRKQNRVGFPETENAELKEKETLL